MKYREGNNQKKDFKFKKSFGFDSKGFTRNNADRISSGAIAIALEKVSLSNKGQSFSVTGVIERVVQTGGPTIFHVSDGTGTLALKAFDGAGVRSYPQIDVNDVVKAIIAIEEYNDELEGEVKTMSKLAEEEKTTFLENLKKLELERAKVEPMPFLVKSDILEKLKERFIKAATQIKLAIIQSRPIIIRHHNDTDGYSAGYSLEKAILPLIIKQHASDKATWEFYTRAPCSAPMYEIDDSIRDTSHSLTNAAKFSNKMPLVLIVDTGSGKEDLMGIKQGKVHGEEFIVVDHHRFEEDVISEETLVHINPWLVGEDGAKFSAGMLCVELARMINQDPELNIIQIPALAGLADRTDNPEVMAEYLKHAEKKGYSKELLRDISLVIDFVSSKLRFMEAREYIEVLFGEPMEKQKALVKLLAPEIKGMDAKGLEIGKSAVKTEKIKDLTLQIIEVEKTFPRGFYPKTGKIVSLLHDYAQETKKLEKVVTLGLMNDGITIRATDKADFSIQEMIKYLNKNIPEAYVEGGGHKNAGSIRFLPFKIEEVLELIKQFIKN